MMASRSPAVGDFLEHVIERLGPVASASARDCEGATALHHAARAGRPEAVDILASRLSGIDVDAADQVRLAPSARANGRA